MFYEIKKAPNGAFLYVQNSANVLIFSKHEHDVKNPHNESKSDKSQNSCHNLAFHQSGYCSQNPCCYRNYNQNVTDDCIPTEIVF